LEQKQLEFKDVLTTTTTHELAGANAELAQIKADIVRQQSQWHSNYNNKHYRKKSPICLNKITIATFYDTLCASESTSIAAM